MNKTQTILYTLKSMYGENFIFQIKESQSAYSFFLFLCEAYHRNDDIINLIDMLRIHDYMRILLDIEYGTK